jgi:hypothetical protein
MVIVWHGRTHGPEGFGIQEQSIVRGAPAYQQPLTVRAEDAPPRGTEKVGGEQSSGREFP